MSLGSLGPLGGLFKKEVEPHPATKITDLPSNVYYKETPIPSKAVKGSAETSEWIKQWEINDAHNKRAISTARKHNKKLQSTYNK